MSCFSKIHDLSHLSSVIEACIRIQTSKLNVVMSISNVSSRSEIIVRVSNKLKYTSLLWASFFASTAPTASHAAWDDLARGFTVVPSSQESLCTEDFFQSVRNLKSIGANMVSIRIAWSVQNSTDSVLYRYNRTASNESLRCGINFIRSQGMDFGLGLVINGPAWRATFEPSDRDAWFAAMGELAVRYSREFAQPYGASYFSLGTEMYSLVSNEHNSENAAAPGRYRWPEIVAAVRAEYSGTITYSAQHSGDRSAVFEDNDLLANLDVLGFSGYWPLYASNKTNLLNEWARIERETILPAYNRYGKPIELAEIGYRPCSFTFVRPYDSSTQCTYDGAAQSLAWDSVLTFFADKTYLVGLVGGWAWNDSPYIGGQGHTDYTPWGKPAADTIASYWPVIASTDVPQVPFGESQLTGVPYCDPADANLPTTGWGNLSNYSVNGVTLGSAGCIFQDGPADNEYGVAPTAISPNVPDDGETVGDTPSTPDEATPGSPSTPLTDNGVGGDTVEGSRILSGSLSLWFLLALFPLVRRHYF